VARSGQQVFRLADDFSSAKCCTSYDNVRMYILKKLLKNAAANLFPVFVLKIGEKGWPQA